LRQVVQSSAFKSDGSVANKPAKNPQIEAAAKAETAIEKGFGRSGTAPTPMMEVI